MTLLLPAGILGFFCESLWLCERGFCTCTLPAPAIGLEHLQRARSSTAETEVTKTTSFINNIQLSQWVYEDYLSIPPFLSWLSCRLLNLLGFSRMNVWRMKNAVDREASSFF